MVTGLDFIAKWDIESFKKKCAKQRGIAQRFPAYDRNMVLIDEYRWKMGPWHLMFMLETWNKRRQVWHGSAAVLELIGHTPVEDVPEQRDLKYKLEVPQEAWLATCSWEPEHFEQARYILAEVFGPILRPGDDHQQALETTGLWSLHHHLKYEGSRV
jgi:hypothetical protein